MNRMVARPDPPDAFDVIDQLQRELDESRRLNARLTRSHDHIAAVLEAFYYVEVTAETLLPVLNLAVALNPQLQRRVS